jgi:hypothetical protein
MARVNAERLARAPYVRTRMFWFRLTPMLATQIEAERDLYAVRPSKAEVTIQLLEEGLAFRRMHRSPPKVKKPKRVPFPPIIVDD